ncbi:MAG: filamentous hemagglutinin N-terminal domain-containing protein [Alphaproteobacteria bacterium]|nr:filamentous hemagglutinin N-terminal domain-containing protein [Alphaproteobacteria bacterium]
MKVQQTTEPKKVALSGTGCLTVFRKRLLSSSALRAVGGGLFGVLILVRVAHALPEGGAVADGQANIVKESPKKLTINQSSDRVIINWKSFNIAADEWTQFVQPSAGSFALNRITGGDPTSILGRLSANGGIMIVNPNGVLFGAGSQIDVNKLIASTANIKNQDFMAGRFNFTQPGNPNAMIVNKGTISIAEKGLAAFVAPAVVNNGVIIARLGKVHLAAGNTFILDMYGDRLVNVAVDSKVMNQVIGLDGKPVDSSVENTGKIMADGGYVALTADVAREAVNNVINTSGVIMARSVSEQGGEIVLDGGEQGIVKVTGTLDASGKNEAEKGGRVIVTGEKVGLFDQAKLDVSGDAGGGRALVGGDYMGGKGDPAKIAAYKIKLEDGPVRNAQFTYVAEGATINADALRNGDGGKAVVWADQATRMYGSILARGGSQGGNGGFIETSGKEYLDVGKFAPLASAAFGKGGTWLMDPRDVLITLANTTNGSFDGGSPNIFTPSGDNSLVDSDTIQNALNSGTSVQVSTGSSGSQTGRIGISGLNLNKSAGGNATLALYAADDIYFSDLGTNITSSFGALNIVMNAANGIHLPFSGGGGAATSIVTNGGSVDLNGNSYVILYGTINAGGGDVVVKANSASSGSSGIKLYSGSHIYGRDITLESTGVVWDADSSTNFNTSIEATRDVTLKGSALGTSTDSLQVVGGNGRTLTVVQTDNPNGGTSGASTQWAYLNVDRSGQGKYFGAIDATMNDKDASSGLSIAFDNSTDRVYLRDYGTTLEKGVHGNGWTPTYAIDTSDHNRNFTLRTDGLKVNIPSSLVRTGTGSYTLASTNVPGTTTTSSTTTTAKNQFQSQISRKQSWNSLDVVSSISAAARDSLLKESLTNMTEWGAAGLVGKQVAGKVVGGVGLGLDLYETGTKINDALKGGDKNAAFAATLFGTAELLSTTLGPVGVVATSTTVKALELGANYSSDRWGAGVGARESDANARDTINRLIDQHVTKLLSGELNWDQIQERKGISDPVKEEIKFQYSVIAVAIAIKNGEIQPDRFDSKWRNLDPTVREVASRVALKLISPSN